MAIVASTMIEPPLTFSVMSARGTPSDKARRLRKSTRGKLATSATEEMTSLEVTCVRMIWPGGSGGGDIGGGAYGGGGAREVAKGGGGDTDGASGGTGGGEGGVRTSQHPAQLQLFAANWEQLISEKK